MTNVQIITIAKAANGVTGDALTYQVWKKRGYRVRKGEHARFSCKIWKRISKVELNEDGENEEVQNGFILKTAHFFTIEQVERI